MDVLLCTMTQFGSFQSSTSPTLIISILKGDTDEEPTFLVKGTKVPLTIDDLSAVYQGKWLNDQVQNL